MSNANHHVVVLGASPKPARYANQAVRLLQQHGYTITPVHPKFAEIEGLPVTSTMGAIEQPIDTLTLYVGAARLDEQVAEIVASRPARVIFNPGTESRALQAALDEAGISWLEACTLVMLKTNQF